MNLFDSIIAGKLGGGGGGGYNWKELGLPYTESGMVELLPETTLTYSEDMGFYVGAVALVVGETYIVNWNGVDYPCVAQDLSAMLPGAVGLGNLADMGGAGNGEPFFGMVMGGELSFEALDGIAELTVAIYLNAETIYKIDPKYLPMYEGESEDA